MVVSLGQADFKDSMIWEKVFRKKEDIVSRNIADELFLVPVRENLADMTGVYSLNPIAGYIWNSIDSSRTLAEIRDLVIEKFDVARETADADIREFISELYSENLIRE